MPLLREAALPIALIFNDRHTKPQMPIFANSFTSTAIHPPVVRCFTPSLVLARFHEARSAMHETTAMIRRLSVDYTKYTKCQACRRRRCITPHLHGPSQPAQTAVRHVSYVMVHQWTSSPNRFYNVLPFYLRWALTSPYFILLLSLPRWLSLVDSGCMKLSMVAMVACLSFFPAVSACAGFRGLHV